MPGQHFAGYPAAVGGVLPSARTLQLELLDEHRWEPRQQPPFAAGVRVTVEAVLGKVFTGHA